MKTRFLSRFTLSVLAAAVGLLVPAAHAATYTWSKTTTGTNWTSSDGTNWLPATAPSSGDSVVLSGTNSGAGSNPVTNFDLTAGSTISAITATSGTYNFTVNGNQMAWGGSGIDLNAMTSGTVTFNNDINLLTTTTLGVTAKKTLILNGLISGTGGITYWRSAGTLTIGNTANTFTGKTTINNNGNLTVGKLANAGVNSSLGAPTGTNATILFPGGATLIWNGATDDSTDRLMSDTTTLSPVLSVQGSHTLTLTGTGGAGTSAIDFNNASAGTFTLEMKDTARGVVSGNITQSGAGALALTVNGGGSGAWRLTGTNSFTGPMNVGLSTLGIVEFDSVVNSGTACALGAGSSITISGPNASLSPQSTLRYIGTDPAGHSTNRPIAMSGNNSQGPCLDASGVGPITYTGGVTGTSTGLSPVFYLAGTGRGEIATIGFSQLGTGTSGIGWGLAKIDAGLWVLSASNVYGGTTSIAGGALRVNDPSAVPSGNIHLKGGVLELTATSGDFTRALGTGANQVQLSAGGGGFSAYGADRTVNLGGLLATATWAAGNFVPSNSTLILSSSFATAMVIFANPINGTTATRTIQVDNGSAPIDAELSGGFSNDAGPGHGLTKTGLGTLSLSATAFSYTGTTTVSAGTLLANASAGSATGTGPVTVSAGATLGGTGIVGGKVAVDGILAPGNPTGVANSAATLTLSSTLTFNASSRLKLDIGTTSDLVTFSASGDYLSGTGNWTLDLKTGAGFAYNTAYTVFSNVTTTGFSPGTVLLDGATLGGGDYSWLNPGGTSYTITLIPEPTIWAMLMGGAGMLVLFRRRTSRR